MSTGSHIQMDEGIEAARKGEYLQAMNLLTEAYNSGQFSARGAKSAAALSYYGLCIALVQKKYKLAIEFCQKAIDLNFFLPDHYANLARVYVAASMRRKAIDTIEKGLKMMPEDKGLKRVHRELGVRSRPAVPFLDRSNPVNKALGRSRHAAKVQVARKRVSERRGD